VQCTNPPPCPTPSLRNAINPAAKLEFVKLKFVKLKFVKLKFDKLEFIKFKFRATHSSEVSSDL